MDGNLLDSDTADTTLARDWSLPELPEGVQNKLQVVLIRAHPWTLVLLVMKHINVVLCFIMIYPDTPTSSTEINTERHA